MSPAELAYRARQRLRRELDRAGGPAVPRFDIEAARAEFGRLAPALAPAAADPAAFRARYAARFPEGRAALLERAAAILDGRVELLGRAFEVGPDPDWHRDPVSGRAWPREFWGGVDTRDGRRVGGVKWVWELNRHHHTVTLARAFLATGDERFAEAVCAQIAGWIAANPYGVGVNWTSALEMALRPINWLYALALIAPSAALDAARFARYQLSIAEQIAYVERHRSAFSSANNHLVGEVAGMALAGLMLPWLPRADAWRRAGLATLAAEIPRQIHPDGVPAEQAFHYLAFVLDFNLLVWLTAARLGQGAPPEWHHRLGAAASFLAHALDGHGHPPAVGDSDDAWVLRLDDRPGASNEASLVATAAALLGDPALRAAAAWDEKSEWLLGPEGEAAFAAVPPGPPPGSRLFRAGGYAVMRAGDRVVTFDCGPLGFLSTAAHGHADALSLTLHDRAGPLLADPGTYAYQEGAEWRRFFRGTAAHNTVRVDGRDQSEMRGTFLWGRRASTTLLDWRSDERRDVAAAEHDGYAPVGVTHRRAVAFLKPDWIVVRDELRGAGAHTVELLWHLPDGAELELVGELARCAAGGRRWAIMGVDWVGGRMEVACGREEPRQGWHSPRYGVVAPAPALSVTRGGELPLTWITAIYLGEGDPADALAAVRDELLAAVALEQA